MHDYLKRFVEIPIKLVEFLRYLGYQTTITDQIIFNTLYVNSFPLLLHFSNTKKDPFNL